MSECYANGWIPQLHVQMGTRVTCTDGYHSYMYKWVPWLHVQMGTTVTCTVAMGMTVYLIS